MLAPIAAKLTCEAAQALALAGLMVIEGRVLVVTPRVVVDTQPMVLVPAKV